MIPPPSSLAEIEAFSRRFGWTGRGDFHRWLEQRVVGAQLLESERVATGESKAQFTRWWMARREETMHKWVREHAPEDVKTAYFSIVANGSAQFLPEKSKHLEIRQAGGQVAAALLEAADNALTEAQELRRMLAEKGGGDTGKRSELDRGLLCSLGLSSAAAALVMSEIEGLRAKVARLEGVAP